MKYMATIYCNNYANDSTTHDKVYFWTVLVDEETRTIKVQDEWSRSYPCELPKLGHKLDYEMDEFWRIGETTYTMDYAW